MTSSPPGTSAHDLRQLAPRGVADAVAAAEAAMAALDAVRAGTAAANTHGGDPGLHRNRSTVVRHAVTHLVGSAAAREALQGQLFGASDELHGPVVDVGAGTAAFSGLLAEALGRDLHVVDIDERHTALAAAAFPGLHGVHTDVTEAPRGAVVSAFEVVEHVVPSGQVAFVASLAQRVLPGGVLVLSTPDESGYPGGWSGYAPHVGPLAPHALARAVTEATGGWPVRVLRVDGPTFSLTPLGAVTQHVANRVWTLAAARVGGLEARATSLVHRVTSATRGHGRLRGRGPGDGPRKRPAVPSDSAWTVRDALTGTWRQGTGLVAVALRPAGEPGDRTAQGAAAPHAWAPEA